MKRVKLQITGLSYSQGQAEAYALILTEEGGAKRNLPVVIGKPEAQAIAMLLEQVESPRPMTHDLIKVITETLGGDVVEVTIVKLVTGIFYAETCLVRDSHTFRIDTRVSDAVALALRFEAPIYCNESVMEAAGFLFEEEQQLEDSSSELSAQESKTFDECSLKQMKMMLNEAVEEEDYEKAAQLKKEIEKRSELEE